MNVVNSELAAENVGLCSQVMQFATMAPVASDVINASSIALQLNTVFALSGAHPRLTSVCVRIMAMTNVQCPWDGAGRGGGQV